MPIPILGKEDVVYKREEDYIHMETGLSESIDAEDNKIEEGGTHDVTVNNEKSVGDIRRKIIDFIKSQGYAHAEGEREFDDETNDLFTKDGTLVEIAVTIGVDNEVIKQIMEDVS
jgi:hypothetical protein